PPKPHPIKEVAATLLGTSTFRHLIIGFAVQSFFCFGILQWQPSFFIRSYGLSSGELGTWFAIIYGVGGLVGTYLGGEFAARFARNNERLQLVVLALINLASAFVMGSAYLVPSMYAAFGLLWVSVAAGNMISAPVFALIQTLIPTRMRATAIALLYFF